MKIAVVGGVGSTLILIEKLAKHGFADVAVWGYHPLNTKNVSGWTDLVCSTEKYNFKYQAFQKISDSESDIQAFSPDVLFVVGLSQLVSSRLLNTPRLGAIGFHPTALPRGRGRAPIAWLVLNESRGAATFFLMREGVDDGPIVAQNFFDVNDRDNAKSVEDKLLVAEGVALDTILPELEFAILNATEQNHCLATWTGRRSPEDGWIDWGGSACKLYKLVSASTEPHPGAYTFSDNVTLRILAAEIVVDPIVGVVGRILSVTGNNGFVVQCGDGLLSITRWESDQPWKPRVGMRLGYYVEAEIHRLRSICSSLEARVLALEGAISSVRHTKFNAEGEATMPKFTGRESASSGRGQ